MSEDILDQPPRPADFLVAYGTEPDQFAELRVPTTPGPHPIVMNIHGGFWRARYNREHASHLCAALTDLGYATWNIEYRRAGIPGGGWPGTFHDVTAAFRKLTEIAPQHRLAAGRVLVMGHSAGGHLALYLAAHQPVTRLISLAGVVDLQRCYHEHLGNDAVVDFLGGTPQQLPDLYRDCDPMQLSIPKHTAQYLVHGDRDDVVPAHFSKDYVLRKQGRGEDVNLVEIPGAGHFELIDPRSAAWPAISALVAARLPL